MSPADDGDEWDDPPLPDEADDRAARDVPWPSNGLASAAWAGWLALGYAFVTGAQAVFTTGSTPLRALPVAGIGVGLLVGVHLAGGDPRLWRRG